MSCHLDSHIITCKLKLKLKVVTFRFNLTLIFNVFAHLHPLSILTNNSNKGFHPFLIQRVEFTKLINSKLISSLLFIRYTKIIPLSEPIAVCILAHKNIKLPLGFASYCWQIPTLKLTLKLKLKITPSFCWRLYMELINFVNRIFTC